MEPLTTAVAEPGKQASPAVRVHFRWTVFTRRTGTCNYTAKIDATTRTDQIAWHLLFALQLHQVVVDYCCAMPAARLWAGQRTASKLDP